MKIINGKLFHSNQNRLSQIDIKYRTISAAFDIVSNSTLGLYGTVLGNELCVSYLHNFSITTERSDSLFKRVPQCNSLLVQLGSSLARNNLKMPVRMISFRGKKNKLYRPRTIWSLLSSLLYPFPVKSLPCRLTASVLQAEYSNFFLPILG